MFYIGAHSIKPLIDVEHIQMLCLKADLFIWQKKDPSPANNNIVFKMQKIVSENIYPIRGLEP